MDNYAELLFINKVREFQDEEGSGDLYERLYPSRTKDSLIDVEIDFISSRESFYIASVSTTGWPYVQHRGGPKGFLKVIGNNLLGFADYRGNRQFITMGHVETNDKVALFLMDYKNRARLKILGRLKMQHAKDVDETLREQLDTQGQGKVERIATIEISAIDWNCPQYIPELINIEEARTLVNNHTQELREENQALKQELKALKAAK